MTFIQEQKSQQRALTFTAVALLHGAAIYALISGFGVEYIREVMPVFTARNIPQEVPKPPPQPSATPERETAIDAPKQPLTLPRQDDRQIVEVSPLPPVPMPPQPLPTFEAAPPSPPAFPPRDARPRGRPGEWVSSADYPARDLREGNHGVTRFSVVIGTNGRVESCVVTASSGSASLDGATCKLIAARARFEPATDGNGGRVTGSFNSAIRWEIPRD